MKRLSILFVALFVSIASFCMPPDTRKLSMVFLFELDALLWINSQQANPDETKTYTWEQNADGTWSAEVVFTCNQ